MTYQISVESASLRIQRVVNNPENNQGSVRKWVNHDRRNERLSKIDSKHVGKEKKELPLSSNESIFWKKNHFRMWDNKSMLFRILPFCLLGLLIIPNIVDCDTIEYPLQPYIYNREEPEQTWKKNTSKFIEMYGNPEKTISQQRSSVTSATHSTIHKSSNSRSRKSGSVKVASKMR